MFLHHSIVMSKWKADMLQIKRHSIMMQSGSSADKAFNLLLY
jgi:hypothetical protein